jgi:hypothetical protein
MRRPPSYSDSFLVIPYRKRDHETPYEEELLAVPEAVLTSPSEQVTWWCTITLFLFKGSFHIFCISAFETAFYFLYVNRSEDAGILSTIDMYYKPLVEQCSTRWSNTSRWLVNELFLYGINQTAIDSLGTSAYTARMEFNHSLLVTASLYSVTTGAFCVVLIWIVIRAKWPVQWHTLLLENTLFIAALAAYEFFFYNTIIYRYLTLSSAELNKYIIDGLSTCRLAAV